MGGRGWLGDLTGAILSACGAYIVTSMFLHHCFQAQFYFLFFNKSKTFLSHEFLIPRSSSVLPHTQLAVAGRETHPDREASHRSPLFLRMTSLCV